MVRILILLLLIYLGYRFFIWMRHLPNRILSHGFRKGPRAPDKRNVIDEMKACAHCGTYQPARSAFQKNGLYFCNRECHEAYRREVKS